MHADKRIAEAAEKLGYGAPVLRDGGHYCVTHLESGAVVVFPATASDHRSVQNAISQLERSCGRKLPKPPRVRQGAACEVRPELLLAAEY